MAFLKKIGKVGGAANKDYRFALGVDEGPSGKSAAGSAVRTANEKKTDFVYKRVTVMGCDSTPPTNLLFFSRIYLYSTCERARHRSNPVQNQAL